MLTSLLVRVAMVALTMGLVCWIGWTIPASRDAEIRLPLLPAPPAPPQPPLHRQAAPPGHAGTAVSAAGARVYATIRLAHTGCESGETARFRTAARYRS